MPSCQKSTWAPLWVWSGGLHCAPCTCCAKIQPFCTVLCTFDLVPMGEKQEEENMHKEGMMDLDESHQVVWTAWQMAETTHRI